MLTATLENLLNRGLPRSPRARQLCAALSGRSTLPRAAVTSPRDWRARSALAAW